MEKNVKMQLSQGSHFMLLLMVQDRCRQLFKIQGRGADHPENNGFWTKTFSRNNRSQCNPRLPNKRRRRDTSQAVAA